MDVGLQGKKIVVTGAARGIGQEICAGFTSAGANIVGVDILDLAETGNRIAALGGDWSAYTVDLESPENVADGCAKILEQNPKIDALVNNAALYGGLKMTPMDKLDLAIWDKVMNINVRGTYLMVRGLLPGLKEAKGKIVNISSGSALRGSPGLLHYVASKGAIIAMTRSMATELGADAINVNAIAPGFVTTEASQGLSDMYDKYLEMTVMAQSIKEPNNAQDIVGTTLYLCSSWADAVTGQLCAVDYGLNKH